jgi:hypothetical protein
MVFVSEELIRPLLAAGKSVVIDGWIHKLVARLLVDGYGAEDLSSVFDGVVEPSLVVLLDPGSDLVWRRARANGRSFGPAELGLYGGYAELGEASFLDYQARFLRELEALMTRSPARVIHIREPLAVEEIVGGRVAT